jgi:glycosyltransferase involved in cell wall biosynthesis
VHILYFADIRFPLERANGIQTFHTCYALARRGHQVRLSVRPDTADVARDPFEFYGAPAIRTLGIDRIGVAGPPVLCRALWLTRALRRAIAGGVAQVTMTRDLGLASLLVRVPRPRRPPVVYESHGFAPEVSASLDEMLSNGPRASSGKQARLGRREARVWKRADGYVTITRALADEMTERFGTRSGLAVVPDGVAIAAHGAAPPIVRHHPPVVGYAGHLYPWKGVDVLLDAIARVPSVRALVVGGLAGEPDLARMRAHARGLNIDDRVTFAGAVPPTEVAARLAEMDVLVLPNTATHTSARYTSPLKLFEYMAAARPVVASDLPALREVLKDGDNALLVAPGDAGQMADAIKRLLHDTALAARLAATAFRDVQAYSWDCRAERLEQILASAAARQLGQSRSSKPRRSGAGRRGPASEELGGMQGPPPVKR